MAEADGNTVIRKIRNGARKDINGKAHVYYDQYWIRYYPPPAETLANKKTLIDQLTRRTFHHTESGINTPGSISRIASTDHGGIRARHIVRHLRATMLRGAPG